MLFCHLNKPFNQSITPLLQDMEQRMSIVLFVMLTTPFHCIFPKPVVTGTIRTEEAYRPMQPTVKQFSCFSCKDPVDCVDHPDNEEFCTTNRIEMKCVSKYINEMLYYRGCEVLPPGVLTTCEIQKRDDEVRVVNCYCRDEQKSCNGPPQCYQCKNCNITTSDQLKECSVSTDLEWFQGCETVLRKGDVTRQCVGANVRRGPIPGDEWLTNRQWDICDDRSSCRCLGSGCNGAPYFFTTADLNKVEIHRCQDILRECLMTFGIDGQNWAVGIPNQFSAALINAACGTPWDNCLKYNNISRSDPDIDSTFRRLNGTQK